MGFAAGEDCASVSAGKHAGFDPDVADLIEGAGIGTLPVIDHLIAEDALTQRFVVMVELALRDFDFFCVAGLRHEFCRKLLFDVFDQRVAAGDGVAR